MPDNEVEADLRARSFSIAHATGEKRRVVFLDAALDALRRSPQSEDHRFPAAHPNIRTGEGETFAERARRPAHPPQGEDQGCDCGAKPGEPCYIDADGPQHHAPRRCPQGEPQRKGHDPGCILPSAHKGPCRPPSPTAAASPPQTTPPSPA